jgi:hypothetical protein
MRPPPRRRRMSCDHASTWGLPGSCYPGVRTSERVGRTVSPVSWIAEPRPWSTSTPESSNPPGSPCVRTSGKELHFATCRISAEAVSPSTRGCDGWSRRTASRPNGTTFGRHACYRGFRMGRFNNAVSAVSGTWRPFSTRGIAVPYGWHPDQWILNLNLHQKMTHDQVFSIAEVFARRLTAGQSAPARPVEGRSPTEEAGWYTVHSHG